jgi:hypothetical protein
MKRRFWCPFAWIGSSARNTLADLDVFIVKELRARTGNHADGNQAADLLCRRFAPGRRQMTRTRLPSSAGTAMTTRDRPCLAGNSSAPAQVAAAPPKRFSGGGYREAMKDDMAVWFEVRVNGARRHHYRLFCRLDYDAEGRRNPC